MNSLQPNEKLKMETVVIILVIGIFAGMLSGFIGVGGGLIVVPCLVYILGMSQHGAQGTSLAMMLPPIGAIAVYNYYKEGHVDFRVAAILCISFVVGSFFGSKIALAISPAQIKKIFGILLIILGAKIVFWK